MMKIIMTLIMLIMLAGSASALEFSVNDYNPKPAKAGEPVDVWFKIENPTNILEKEVYIEVIPKDGLTLTPGEPGRKSIGMMPHLTSQTKRFRFMVSDDAFEGTHKIEVIIITGISSVKRELSIQVAKKDIKEIDLAIGDIESDPARIKPDDEDVKLEITIQNLGDGRALGVKTELTNLPDGIIPSESYSGISLLGNIEADSSGTATFYIDVDENVAPGEYTVKIKTKYKYKPDEDENDYLSREEDIPLSIVIKPVPLYEITKAELEPKILTAGDREVKLRLTIKNIGEETGESVRIKAYGKTEQPITFDKSSDFVAPMLEPGDEGQATLEFKIDEDANLQKYYLDIEIKNILRDDVITYNKKVPVTISNPRPDNPYGLVSVGAILILAIVFGIWLRGRKNKQKVKPKKARGSYGKSYLDKVEHKKS